MKYLYVDTVLFKYYEQVHDTTMGPPISHIVANLFIGECASKIISTSPQSPGFGFGMWMTPLSSNR